MKLDKLVYSIREGLREYGDDSDLSDRFIIFLLDIKRAILISQKLNSYTTKFPTSAEQTLCIELEEVSRFKCGIDITCKTVQRSTVPLPKLFDTVVGNSLIAVDSLDILEKAFSKIDMKLVPYIQYSMFKDKIYTFIDENNYLYVYSLNDSHKFLECVQVRGVFETPLDLEDFQNCCGCTPSITTSCFNTDSDYPIPGEFVTVIKDMVLEDIIKLNNIKGETINDSEDSN